MAEVGGDLLEVAQQPGAEPGAAPAGVDPHPLDLADAGADLLDPAARDRLAVAGGHHERPRARRHVLLVVVVARVEAGGEARVELVEVAPHGLLRLRRAGWTERRSTVAARTSRSAVASASVSRSCWRAGQRRDQPLRELLGPVVEPAAEGAALAVSRTVRRRRSSGSGATCTRPPSSRRRSWRAS